MQDIGWDDGGYLTGRLVTGYLVFQEGGYADH